VATPSSVTVVRPRALAGCPPLAAVATPEASVAELHDTAFDCINGLPLRAVDYGRAAGLAAPNRSPVLNGAARATRSH